MKPRWVAGWTSALLPGEDQDGDIDDYEDHENIKVVMK